MRQATHGDTVSVHYRGKLHDGSVFDASLDRESLQYTSVEVKSFRVLKKPWWE